MRVMVNLRRSFDMFMFLSVIVKILLEACYATFIDSNRSNSYRNCTNDDTISNNNSKQWCSNSSGGSYNSSNNDNDSDSNSLIRVIVEERVEM